MTKSELISRLAARYPQLGAKDAELAVKVILDAMAKSLSQGQRIEIRGFGSFDLNYRPPRTGRNPKSGEKVRGAGKVCSSFQGRERNARASRSERLKIIVRWAGYNGGRIRDPAAFFMRG